MSKALPRLSVPERMALAAYAVLMTVAMPPRDKR